MKKRLITLVSLCCFTLAGSLPAQAPGGKAAPPAKSAADLAVDAFNKERGAPGARDQARFQKVIAAGMEYLAKHSTHSRVSEVITNLAFYAGAIDAKQVELRTSYISFLKLELANQRYKDGISDATKTVMAALDAAIADFEVRGAFNRDNLANLREKIDALAESPGGGRFLVDRERSYGHVLTIGTTPARGEEHFKALLTHKENSVKSMAREELNIYEAKKQPLALKFTGLDGKEVDLSQLRGKVVALYFWSSANKGSTDRFATLQQIHGDYRKRGFEVVTVSFDKEEDRAKLLKYVKDERINFPTYFDGKGAKNDFAQKLNVTGVPRLLVFDQKGILQTTLQGNPVGRITADLPQNQLEGMVKRLLGIK